MSGGVFHLTPVCSNVVQLKREYCQLGSLKAVTSQPVAVPKPFIVDRSAFDTARQSQRARQVDLAVSRMFCDLWSGASDRLQSSIFSLVSRHCRNGKEDLSFTEVNLITTSHNIQIPHNFMVGKSQQQKKKKRNFNLNVTLLLGICFDECNMFM